MAAGLSIIVWLMSLGSLGKPHTAYSGCHAILAHMTKPPQRTTKRGPERCVSAEVESSLLQKEENMAKGLRSYCGSIR